jgi:(2Fe-2S) ferredoxin
VEERGTPPFQRVLLVCVRERPEGGAACGSRGGDAIQAKLKEYAKSRGLQGRCRVSRVHCLGLCAGGPNVAVMPENVWYSAVSLADVDAIGRKWIDPLV